MKRISVTLVLAIAAATTGIQAQNSPTAPVPQFQLLSTIPTGGEGKWDYVTLDPDTRRLFISRSSHVQVLDLDSQKVVGDLPGTDGVHGIAIVADKNLGFTTNGKTNNVTVFDLKTLKESKKINTGKRPDAIVYDAASKHVFVMNHSGGDITVIDPANLDAATVNIQVGGALEFAVVDGAGNLFVNVEDKSEIVKVDTKANKVLAHWSTAPGKDPTGLAIDVKNHRLFSGCDQKMVVVDTESGKMIANLPIGRGVDGVAFDEALGVAMSADGQDGTVTVVKEVSPEKFEVAQTVKTLQGARTITLDAKTHHVLLPCNVPDGKGGNTFGIAVVGPETK